MASSDLAIHVNSQETFFLNQRIVCLYFGKLRKIIKQEIRRNQIKISAIEIEDFPGGPAGFEQVAIFCYNGGGRVRLTAANVSLYYCSAVFLGMTTEEGGNLLRQTEEFLAGVLDWPLADVVACLKTCDGFFRYADSLGLVQRLVSGMLVKISDDRERVSSDSGKAAEWWWFDELVGLSPVVIEMMVKKLGAFGSENKSLTLTRFLLHYLKKRVPRARAQPSPIRTSNSDSVSLSMPESRLADTAIHGVISSGRKAFSYRGLLCVLRVVSAFKPTKHFKGELERMIGELLDQANLDDLLVCGGGAGVYDVDLVIRLVRIFVLCSKEDGHGSRKMRRVVRLLDKYLREISPDHGLQLSKFLEVAESLPKSARDCFDGVYRAIDIYLEVSNFSFYHFLVRCFVCVLLRAVRIPT
ncbi:BTB/POZ domain-containing protein At3g19850 [Linum grandiflorum]